ncbi:MAG: hypothetical protein VYB44_07340 [Bacteroidota bacterium]|nr:hypothetical protein [Bacteroidota bacterium]
MTRFIRLESVCTALDPENLLTHPITSEGLILETNMPLQDCESSWFACLSTQDEKIVHLAIEAFESKRLLKEITSSKELKSLIKGNKIDSDIKEFFNVAGEIDHSDKENTKLFRQLDKVFFRKEVVNG